MASLNFCNHLYRPALLLQSRWFSHYEATRRIGARQSLSGDDVARDGLVPLVRIDHGGHGPSLLLSTVERRRAQCGRPVADSQVVWMVASGLARGLRVDLPIPASIRRNSRQSLAARDLNFDHRCRSFVAGAGPEWGTERFQRSSVHQRRRRPWFSDAHECLGSRLARAETADYLDSRARGTGHAHAAASPTHGALEFPGLARGFLAFIPDAFLHGRGRALSVPEQHFPLNSMCPNAIPPRLYE